MHKWVSERSIPEPNSGCWLWTGYVNSDGYGRAIWHKKVRGAHRISYELACSPVPDGMVVMHKCDVRCCVNPDHLTVGTQAQNIEDATRKGRMSSPTKGKWWLGKKRSESQKIQLSLSRSPLVLTQIRAILSDPRPNSVIAAEYGIHRTAVYRIKSGASFSKALAQDEVL